MHDGGPYTQSSEIMLSSDERFTQINGAMRTLLEKMAVATA